MKKKERKKLRKVDIKYNLPIGFTERLKETLNERNTNLLVRNKAHR